ncbi:hypothetical protein CEXT_301851 [Caerostris extrusa]|uniref:Uncharacterized protein n=1 Tax=Caerostris extrusa TaxID=172846 RepID=A0AAV4VX79_CAEEX|nr:hypothetical protein CEXT_301851 [Caerostris extrusa]
MYISSRGIRTDLSVSPSIRRKTGFSGQCEYKIKFSKNSRIKATLLFYHNAIFENPRSHLLDQESVTIPITFRRFTAFFFLRLKLARTSF